MPIDTLITIGVFTAVALLFIFAGVKTVPQGNNWTVERFGRYTHPSTRLELNHSIH